jgi:DnaK suppressor protein
VSSALDPESVRSRLLVERDELRALASSSREARKPIALDQQSVGRLSRMSAIEQQAMLHEAQRRRETRERAIDAALARLEAEEYGDCLRCGEPIDPRRLALDLAAAQCMPCARLVARPGQ